MPKRKAVTRPDDPDNALDYSGYWYLRAFGRTIFSAGEIMRGGREFRTMWIAVVTAQYEYMWDQDSGNRRRLQNVRSDAEARATEWVGGLIDGWLERFADGDDLYEIIIEFDSSKGWATDRLVR